MSKHALVLTFHQINQKVRLSIDNTSEDKFVSVHSSETVETLKNKVIMDPTNLVAAKILTNDHRDLFALPKCPGHGYYLETAPATEIEPGLPHTNNTGFVWRKSNNASLHNITKSIELSEKNVNNRLEALSKRIDALERENDKLTADLMKTNNLVLELDAALGNIGRVEDDEPGEGTNIRTKTAKSILESTKPIVNEAGEIIVNGPVANIVAALVKLQLESKKD